jgi:hypothetical protein
VQLLHLTVCRNAATYNSTAPALKGLTACCPSCETGQTKLLHTPPKVALASHTSAHLFAHQQPLQMVDLLLPHLHPSYQHRQPLLAPLLLLHCCRLHLILALAWAHLLF